MHKIYHNVLYLGYEIKNVILFLKKSISIAILTYVFKLKAPHDLDLIKLVSKTDFIKLCTLQ